VEKTIIRLYYHFLKVRHFTRFVLYGAKWRTGKRTFRKEININYFRGLFFYRNSMNEK
jgi:hypothetical protein